MPHTSRRSSAARPRWPADRRDEIVAATLVGMVVVLLGYASGIGVSAGMGAPSAGSTPGAVTELPSANPTSPAPVIVSATGAPGGDATSDPGGYYTYYGSGDGNSTLPTGAASDGAGNASAPAGIPSAQPSVSGGDTTVVVGGAGSTPTPSATASSGPQTTSVLACVLGSSGLSGVLPTSTPTGGLLGGVLSGVGTSVDSVVNDLLGSCSTTASATPAPTPTETR